MLWSRSASFDIFRRQDFEFGVCGLGRCVYITHIAADLSVLESVGQDEPQEPMRVSRGACRQAARYQRGVPSADVFRLELLQEFMAEVWSDLLGGDLAVSLQRFQTAPSSSVEPVLDVLANRGLRG